MGIKGFDYANFDLNKLYIHDTTVDISQHTRSREDCEEHKAAMEKTFLAHQKKASDPDFVYDKRVHDFIFTL